VESGPTPSETLLEVGGAAEVVELPQPVYELRERALEARRPDRRSTARAAKQPVSAGALELDQEELLGVRVSDDEVGAKVAAKCIFECERFRQTQIRKVVSNQKREVRAGSEKR